VSTSGFIAAVLSNAHVRIGLYVLVVAQSGERKTSADKQMSKPIRTWALDKTAAMKPEVDTARAKIAVHQAEKDGLLAKIKAGAGRPGGKSGKAKVETADLDKLKSDLEILETQAPVAPIVPEMFYEDVTSEKMAEDLALGWPSASLWSDEAGLVVGGHGMGRDSIMRYLALINRLWDGQPFSRKRSTTKSFTVKGRRLTTCLMMQETVLRQLLAAGDGVSRGSGFMARFLMACPVSTMGTRFYRPGDPDDPALAAYDAKLRALLDMPLPVDSEGMVLKPPVLPLSGDARETWIEFHDDVERELHRHGEFFDVKDIAA
jgi:putative DNA primase/helicase